MQNIIDKFLINDKVTLITPHGNGHINNSYLVETTALSGFKRRYLLQAVNKNVFSDSEGLMANIEKVINYLRERSGDGRGVMKLIPAKTGRYFHIDENGTCWRVYDFIENAICLEAPESPEDFYECGFGFGNFQSQLCAFPASTLTETIPDFHNTPKRFENFLKAVEADVCGRAAEVQEEINFVLSEKDFYSVLYDNMAEGKLPLRVTHNDTKSNNVMLDAVTRKSLCVIDLDTIMPGFSVNDFGDAIRFGANTAAEDEKDLSKVSLDMEMFDYFARGFIKGCDGHLLESEIMLMPEGAKMMTVECGMRFLTDYLQGDTYFKTKYPRHNLDRCRTQFELVRDMNRHWQDMKDTVKKYI